MKIKLVYFLIILCCYVSFPQTFDTLKVNTTRADTLTFGDSTKVIVPDSTARDSAALFKSVKDTIAIDTLKPLYKSPYNIISNFIQHDRILRSDYKYTGDMLKLFPSAFINEHGIYGGYDEVFLYGMPPSSVSFQKSMIEQNNRFSRDYNLNLMQPESIDSIEIVNLPRGFLYSADNNPITVNFIGKDLLTAEPYTRIKYYEGPYGMALFDGIFNTFVLKKLNMFIDITNRKGDRSYINTDFSIWQAQFKLKYLMSNNLNLIASYNYVKSETGLNGGINVDSIAANSSSIQSVLYDVIAAPVFSSVSRQEVNQHAFKLQTLWLPNDHWRSDLIFYYFFDQNSLRDVVTDSSLFKNKNYSYGVALNQGYNTGALDLQLLTTYDNRNIRNYFSFFSQPVPDFRNYSAYRFTLSPRASYYFGDSTLIPSVFLKYAAHKNIGATSLNSLAGYGFDLSYSPGPVKLYFGYSTFKMDYSSINSKTMEVSASYNPDSALNVKLNYFSIDSYMPSYIPIGANSQAPANIHGTGFSLRFFIWKILFENYSSFYFNNPDYIPDYNLNTGIYYKNILFNEHLDLKAGFELYFAPGDQLKSLYNPVLSTLFHKYNYRVDFTLSGVVSKLAIVYFTWENLTGNNYFIVPFYPMPARNIRFGLSWELFN